MKRRLQVILLIFSISLFQVSAQQNGVKKYPSLFWEITGNGLKKPSYLFGTMHVSSKMVFNLSDSFYYALKSTDAVALELNPESWQDQMFWLQNAQSNISNFSSKGFSDYLNETSFQLMKYEDNLKRALSEEPTVVNSLLYRSYGATADFEENTYLDLYIYQTGRKLGKTAAGVENYLETEKLMMEAYTDMAKEKNKKPVDTEGLNMFEIQQKMQDAYRKGDLDLMDSLDNMTVTSPAFTEKFLYLRNRIQAHSIDTIVKHRSLFVGVGAAHLPGKRGVIELLREKGYKLRPIYMLDRDAKQKDQIDKLTVPVKFKSITTEDGNITLQVPGNLYAREESRMNNSWQYADMNNGSYYMLTRVLHNAPMFGENEKNVLSKIDSMLYENIPGKILQKTAITKGEFKGYNIVNRTRRGDMQRFNILITPFEVLVFKMSGNDKYVEGKEGETFFNSIQIKGAAEAKWTSFSPKQGGFTVNLPATPVEVLDKKNSDRIARWQYAATDPKTGDAYLIWKKSVYNTNFIEEDTFDLSLIEESFKKSEIIKKEISRKLVVSNGSSYLDMSFLSNTGDIIKARAFIKGPHYYLVAVRSQDKRNNFSEFFNSFKFNDYKYAEGVTYVDTFLNIKVVSPIQPKLDTAFRALVEKATAEQMNAGLQNLYTNWPKTNSGIFKSDTTGEAILVSVETFPKYYYSPNKEKFWQDKLDEKNLRKDYIIYSKKYIQLADSVTGYQLQLRDTNSSRAIFTTSLLKDNKLYKFSTVADTLGNESSFIKTFFSSLAPLQKKNVPSVFVSKQKTFFNDYYSKDSSTKYIANQAIPSIQFGKEGLDKIEEAINKLKFGDKDYLETKSKFITELGFIDDSCCKEKVVATLKNLYEKTADTSYFQNAVLFSLARLQTQDSYKFLKNILTEDPPVFETSYDYTKLFTLLADSLALSKTLFPEILPLTAVEDYRPRINSLLKSMVDSGFVTAKDYESYFTKLFFDAKLQLKKQQTRDEKRLEKDGRQEEVLNVRGRDNTNSTSSASALVDYSALLVPFYDKHTQVQKYFDKLIESKDADVRLKTALILIKNNHSVDDSVVLNLAANDQFRSRLFSGLDKINRVDLFPAKYKTQEAVAQSFLLNDRNLSAFSKIEFAGKKYVEVKDKKGFVYYFKYKMSKDEEWQIGISGLQPVKQTEVNSDNTLVRMTEKKIKGSEPVPAQFDEQLKKLIFSMHKSSRNFNTSENGGAFRRRFGDLDDFKN